MALNIQPNIKRAKLAQLHCSICKGYLSCAPIRFVPDGSNICGRRSPLEKDALVYRVPALETMLSDTTFPCTYKQYGCTASLLFGRTTEHEAKCEYHPVTCASLPNTTCSWEGSRIQIPEHFTKQHRDLVKQNAEFKLELGENRQGILMVVKNNYAFIIRYMYDADTSSLIIDVGCFACYKEEDFCKIKLTNSLDPNYTISLKGPKCILYNHNFFVAENVTVLDIKEFRDNLKDSKSIGVTLILPNYNAINVAEFIDYDLLATSKCGKCQYYLIPPVYDYKDVIICADCSYRGNCEPCSDEKLQNILVGQNYPCRWRGCEFTTKGDAIRNHEISCTYRMYRCFFEQCGIIFGPSEITEHLQVHKYQYFVDKLEYKMCFKKTAKEINAFTILQNEIICITYSNCSYGGTSYKMKTSSFDPKRFTLQVYFEHNHCKCTSNTFSLHDSNKLLRIKFSQLPICFHENEEVSVTVKVV